jgi:hypothetical protein
MEEVLDVDAESFDATHPLICMDEASKRVVADVEPALPMAPGRPRRHDHHYRREGVRALFLFFDPIAGWRRVSSRASRTRRDWAEEIRTLLEVDYPEAEVVTVVLDTLNTHDTASLYEAFDAETAHRLARRLRLVHTPPNGSWLNLAEMELSILARQCIGRRFDSVEELDRAIAAWQEERNRLGLGARWRFTTPTRGSSCGGSTRSRRTFSGGRSTTRSLAVLKAISRRAFAIGIQWFTAEKPARKWPRASQVTYYISSILRVEEAGQALFYGIY